jgi:hypothetical protein
MASKIWCQCGTTIRTNLFEGHENLLLVREALIESVELDIESLIVESDVVAECKICQRLHIIYNDGSFSTYEKISSTWSVWRQDDNGNEIRMASLLKESEAQALVDEFESRGHKQMYWIKED